jgi:AraC-like DNA-binding protein
MEPKILETISPFVRLVKIQKSQLIAGEWIDYDNVFTYVAQGEAEFIIGGNRYQVREGDAVIIRPFLTHIVNIKPSNELVQYIFHFDLFYDEARSRLTKIGVKNPPGALPDGELLLTAYPPVVHISHVNQPYIKNRFLTMRKEFIEKNAHYGIVLKSIALEMLSMFIRSAAVYVSDKNKMSRCWATVEKAINHINENYHDNELNNLKISRAAGVTSNHLSHVFKKQLGISMHRYITSVRLEKSKDLLLHTDYKATVIASLTGFSDIHVFSKVFKKIVGMTPSEFIASTTADSNPEG